ncbi:MAG TPA: hypothetical protein VGL13_05735 [Polyangiaceae bacterium]
MSSVGAGWVAAACATDNTDPCMIVAREPPDLQSTPFEARLFLVTPGDGVVRDSSKCMSIPPCFDARYHNSCLADALNQQLDGAIPDGLGFNGLDDPSHMQLVLAMFQPSDPNGPNGPCDPVNLVACAGFAQPLGGGDFDISCASCQGGTKSPQGRDNTPCSATRGCFLNACAALIGGSPAQ